MGNNINNVRVYFRVEGAAFDEFPATEIGNILRNIASKIEAGEDKGLIRCTNGNRLGTWLIGKGN